MKKKILLITKYNNTTGFGNFVRCTKFYKYLSKKYKCRMYVDTKLNNSKNLKKYFKNFKIFNLDKFKFNKNIPIFLDYPKVSKKIFNKLKKGSLICYGNSNSFNYKKTIIPFNYRSRKYSSIFYSITGNNFIPIKYTSKKQLFFFIYLSTDYNKNFLKNIVFKIRNRFSNKIIIYCPYGKLNNIYEEKNVILTKTLDPNYIKNNMIYIGNIGSGAIDRAIRGVFSLTYSKNNNEEKIFQSLKKYHKCLFFFGNKNNFDYKRFEMRINYLYSGIYPLRKIKKNYFKNNNLKLEKKVVSLVTK